jgi:hypothetical protein
LIAVGLVDLVHALVATDRASGLIAVGLEMLIILILVTGLTLMTALSSLVLLNMIAAPCY